MSSRFPNSRADAAREIVAKGGIRIDGDSIIVPSSDGRREYAVKLIDGRPICNCEDFRRRQMDCKHVEASRLWVERREEQREREMSKV